MKVDDHKNKSIISPGRLVGLNVFSEFYVGGYTEYLPDLLPNGASFKNGFQGKAHYNFCTINTCFKQREKKKFLKNVPVVPKPAMWTFLIRLDQSII